MITIGRQRSFVLFFFLIITLLLLTPIITNAGIDPSVQTDAVQHRGLDQNFEPSASGHSEWIDGQGVDHVASDLLGSQNVTLMGMIGGGITAVAVQDNYAYVGEGALLRILDISDPVSPKIVGKNVSLPKPVSELVVAGDYIYVACYEAGLRIIEITDPVNPSEVGYFETPQPARDVAVLGNYAYVIDGKFNDKTNGLRVIDIKDPTSPQEIDFMQTPGYALAVALAGSYAYVVDHDLLSGEHAGLRIIDISNPAGLKEAGFYEGSEALDVDVAGNHAYFLRGFFFPEGGSGLLEIIDIRKPAAPREVAAVLTNEPRHVSVHGNTAYVTVGNDGLSIIDIADPTNPTYLTTYDTAGNARRVTVVENNAYVADGSGGLHIIGIADRNAPYEIGVYNTAGVLKQVVIAGDFAYGTSWQKLSIIDISDPIRPSFTGWQMHGIPTFSPAIALVGDYAYLAMRAHRPDYGYGWLRIVDVSSLQNPVEAAIYDTPGHSDDLDVEGAVAAIADGSAGLRLVDVSNPAKPKEINFIDKYARKVVVEGDYAYITSLGDDDLVIIDISNPDSLVEKGSHDTPGFAANLDVVGDYVYIVDYNAGLRIIDVSDADAPSEAGSLATPGDALDVAVSGHYAYVILANVGLYIIDVSNPKAPTEAGYYRTAGSASGVAVGTQYVTVADADGGLVILRPDLGSVTLAVETEPTSSTAFDFTGDLASFLLNSGQNKLFSYLGAGDYTVTETAALGWALNRVECDSENVTVADDGATIHLTLAEDVNCTFINRRLAVTADAGGPYTGLAGDPILLDANDTANAEMVKLFSWDCTSDGTIDTSSTSPTGSTCTYAGNGQYVAKLKTTDVFAQQSVDTAQVTISQRTLNLPLLLK